MAYKLPAITITCPKCKTARQSVLTGLEIAIYFMCNHCDRLIPFKVVPKSKDRK